MATSEYIPDRANSAEDLSSLPAASRPMRGGILKKSMLAPLPTVLSDVAVILLALGLAVFLRAFFLDKEIRLIDLWHSIGRASVAAFYLSWFVLVYVLAARRYGLYGQLLKTASGAHELRMTAQACLNAGMLLCGALYMAHDLAVSRAVVLLLTLSAMAALCIRRAAARVARYRQYERGLSTRHVVILGTNPLSLALGKKIRDDIRLGYTFRGYLLASSSQPSSTSSSHILGSLDQLNTIVRKYFIDEVIIAEQCPIESVIRIIEEASELGIDVRTFSGYY
ncbi:MAG TPA: hypothetical protein VFI72_18715, partial [Candidatus Angelobacter sp.]|nr:hypothetical protein [Candidatus Angelobacter sp.]